VAAGRFGGRVKVLENGVAPESSNFSHSKLRFWLLIADKKPEFDNLPAALLA